MIGEERILGKFPRAHGEFFGLRQRAAGCSASRNPATSMSMAHDGAPMTPINLGPCHKDLPLCW
jgi:hypothetical protein